MNTAVRTPFLGTSVNDAVAGASHMGLATLSPSSAVTAGTTVISKTCRLSGHCLHKPIALCVPVPL